MKASDEFTTMEAADMLGVSYRTIWNWMERGLIKPDRSAPGANGSHTWTGKNLRRIARQQGKTLTS